MTKTTIKIHGARLWSAARTRLRHRPEQFKHELDMKALRRVTTRAAARKTSSG